MGIAHVQTPLYGQRKHYSHPSAHNSSQSLVDMTQSLLLWQSPSLMNSGSKDYPLVNVYITMEITIFNGKIHYFYGPCSIAMFVYQRELVTFLLGRPVTYGTLLCATGRFVSLLPKFQPQSTHDEG